MRKNILLFLIFIYSLIFINLSCKQRKTEKKKYTHIFEVEYRSSKTEVPLVDKEEYSLERYNDEDSYLFFYSRVCFFSILNVSNGGTQKISLLSMKLINNEGEDIIPDIDFPEREIKEIKVWEKERTIQLAKKRWVLEQDSIQLARPDILTVLSDTTLRGDIAMEGAKKKYEERIEDMKKKKDAISKIEKMERPIIK